MAKRFVFSVLGILTGLLLVTLISESVEIMIVKTLSGKSLTELTQNQDEYFAIRNEPTIVALKLVYNTTAAFIGGYACAVVVRGRVLLPVLILAGIQALGFVYGMTLSPYASTTALWLWLTLTVLSVGAIIGAGRLHTWRVEKQGRRE